MTEIAASEIQIDRHRPLSHSAGSRGPAQHPEVIYTAKLIAGKVKYVY